MDYTSLTVDELREKILEMGFPKAQLDLIKGKRALLELVSNLLLPQTESEVNLDDAVLETGDVELDESDSGPVENKAPMIGSPGWQDHVLSLLVVGEYVTKGTAKLPKASGLRRVAQLLLGPIVSSGPVQVWPSNGPDNNAAVHYAVQFMWTHGMKQTEWMSEHDLAQLDIQTRTFSEVADSNRNNTQAPFDSYTTATASTRAEGRALKKALQLNILTAEESLFVEKDTDEMKLIPGLDDTNFATEKVSGPQLGMINMLVGRLNLDLPKVLAHFSLPNELSDLKRSEAATLIVNLNKYQTITDVSESVPDMVKK